MCNQCRLEIDLFRERMDPGPWNLDRIQVADRLQEIMNDPDSIQQGEEGLCGWAAFLRAWALHDHASLARFAIRLYDTGASEIGGFEVKPDTALFEKYVPGGQLAPAADWMLLRTLQDIEECIPCGQSPGDIVKWLNASGLFHSVLDETAANPAGLPVARKGMHHALELKPNRYTEVILHVNLDLIRHQLASSDIRARIGEQIPENSTQYIGVSSPIEKIGIWEDGIDAVFVDPETNFAYFFKNDEWLRYDLISERSSSCFPAKINGSWPGIWSTDIDAVFYDSIIKKVYFFKGEEYIRYDCASGRADSGYPARTKKGWPGVWEEGIDAAFVNTDTNIAYFFRGDEYVKYDLVSDRAYKGYPAKIETNWPGIWNSNIDTAFFDPVRKKIYFFKGEEYIRFDAQSELPDEGYPVKLRSRWPDINFSYYAWGRVFKNARFSREDFDRNYYGAIVAQARTPKIHAPLPAPPNPPFELSAVLEDSTVVLSWKSANLNDTHYVVERKKGCGGNFKANFKNNELQVVPASRPSTLGARYRDEMDQMPSDIYFYRVTAVNGSGTSEYSQVIGISIPTGKTRIADPDSPEISRPPSYVRQVAVMRGPAGLEPIGYARFESDPSRYNQPHIVYDARWEKSGPHEMKLIREQSAPFKPGRTGYVFVRFGNESAEGGIRMEEGSVTLNLNGTKPDGSVTELPVALSFSADDSSDGMYYWGSFDLEDNWQANYKLRIAISGRDAFERYALRKPSGHEIDSDPTMEAYPLLNLPPYYPFANYTPGTDRSHVLEIATIVKTLPVDSFPGNNDFASATPIQLESNGGKSGMPVELDHLNLSREGDADFFTIACGSSEKDEKCSIIEPVRKFLSRLMGLYIVNNPPVFSTWIYTENQAWLDIELYKSDAFNRELTHRIPGFSRVNVYNPAKAFFPDSRFYAVIRNNDYASQGAIRYKIRFAYNHARDEIGIDTNAPTFRPRTREGCSFHRKIYERTGLPGPGEDWIARQSRDARELIRNISSFMLDPQTAVELRAILGRDIAVEFAEDLATLGNTAQIMSLYEEAEKLYLESYIRFTAADDRKAQLCVLKDMHALYSEAGMKSKLKKVAAEIGKIQDLPAQASGAN